MTMFDDSAFLQRTLRGRIREKTERNEQGSVLEIDVMGQPWTKGPRSFAKLSRVFLPHFRGFSLKNSAKIVRVRFSIPIMLAENPTKRCQMYHVELSLCIFLSYIKDLSNIISLPLSI